MRTKFTLPLQSIAFVIVSITLTQRAFCDDNNPRLPSQNYQIDGNFIIAGAVGTKELAAEAVTGAKIAPNTIEASNLSSTLITTIANSGVSAKSYKNTTPLAANAQVLFIDSTGTVGTNLQEGNGNTAMGWSALQNNTGAANTAIGSYSLSGINTGENNTAIGGYVLCLNTSGNNNTGLGTGALYSNTTGTNNTASGEGALSHNTTGSYNTAHGTDSLLMNSTGDSNTALGTGALSNNNSGTNNTAVGRSSLISNSTGINNTAVGKESLYVNTTGASNTATGYQTLFYNTTGNNNVGTGVQALEHNTTGSNNSAHGAAALLHNTTGSNNIAVGFQALQSNLTGEYNIAVGDNALQHTTTSGLTAVGSGALAANTTGAQNVAIGFQALHANTTGQANTSIGQNSLNINTTGNHNTAVGLSALAANLTGSDNTAIGYQALVSTNTGTKNIALGSGAGFNYTTLESNNICIGNAGVTGDSGAIRIGGVSQTAAYIAGVRGITTGQNDAVAVVIDSNGQLGTVSSSRRYKQDIAPISSKQTDALRALQPVSFTYTRHAPGSRSYGLIAEEVANVMPELVIYNKDNQPETVRYQELAPLLIKAYQDLDAAAKKHDADTAQLLERLAQLEAVVALLQKK